MDIDNEQLIRQIKTGKSITDRRKELGFGLTQAAKLLGISAPYMSEIEKGLKLPSDSLIRELSKVLLIDEDELFTRFGKIPLLAREQFEEMEPLQITLAKIRAKNVDEDTKQRMLDKITQLYAEFLKELEDE